MPNLEIPKMIKSLSTLEIALLVLFVIYLILPIQTPGFLHGVFDSALGMLSLFVIAVYLFFNVNPIVAVLFVLVAYELLRRSSQYVSKQTVLQYTPSQIKKDAHMVAMNPPKKETLEEEIVDKMAPIGHSDASVYTESTFKPVADNLIGASLV